MLWPAFDVIHENGILMCLSYLVYLFIDQITDINIKICDEYSYCVAMHEYDIVFVFYQLVCFYIFFKYFFTAIK